MSRRTPGQNLGTPIPGVPRSVSQQDQIMLGDNDFSESGRPDLNRRPPEPHSGALPGCATSRDTGN
jgi:hypothetical protein